MRFHIVMSIQGVPPRKNASRHASKNRPSLRRFVTSLERLEERVVMTTYPTTTVLAESAASGSLGTNVTFTATVSSANGMPTGSVVFQDGSTSLGTVSLSGGMATLSTSSLSLGSHLIRAVYLGTNTYYDSASSGVSQSSPVSTVAGTGGSGYTGDGGQATSATLNQPENIAFDSQGNMYIADTNNFVIRKVTPSGVISTVVGNGTGGYSGDGGPATSAEITFPYGMAFDSSGDLFFADYAANVVREVNTAGIISTAAGTGTANYSGDGGPATSATLTNPTDVAFNAAGDLFIADSGNEVIREVNQSGIISTVVGNGTTGYSGDGGPAASAELDNPSAVTFDTSGNMFIADTGNEVIREVTPAGVISTAVGNGSQGYSGDGGPATSAAMNGPNSVEFDAFGDLFITEGINNVVREVYSDGIITTVLPGLYQPSGLAMNSSGSLFIADVGSNVIVEAAAASLTTYTVAAAPAKVSLAVNATPQTTTFQAMVDTASGSPLSGGTVSFYDGNLLLGVAPVVNGIAVFDYPTLSPGTHALSAVFSGTEDAGANSATRTITVSAAETANPSVVGLSRYPVHNNRTLVSLFFDQTLNPAEALWKHNYKLHTGSGGNIKISHIYFDPATSTVTLLPAKRLATRNTYNLKLLGLSSSSKGSTPAVTSSGWLALSFKAKINHKAFSIPGALPAITFVNGQEVSTRP